MKVYNLRWSSPGRRATRSQGKVLETFRKPGLAEEVRLSEQEANVLKLIASGETKKGVAQAMDLSYNTVDQYLRRIFAKLHVHSLPAAVRIAMQKGLIDFF